MKNFNHEGRTMTVLAPSDLVSGQGFMLGAVFLVAVKDALTGLPVAGYRLGCFTLPATAADAWAQGDKLYWDATAGELTDVGANGVLIGIADEAKLATTTTGKVVVTGQVV